MKAIITVGISGSGKTTWAEDFCIGHSDWFNSNRDDIRFTEITQVRDWSKYKFNKANEDKVTEIQQSDWKNAAAQGRNIIVSDTHLTAKARNNTATALKRLGYEVEFKDFPITLEEAWRRDSLRPNGVGREVLYKQWKNWLVYIGKQIYCPNDDLPKAVMFDIDGTLAHMDGRTPYDWEHVGNDRVDPHLKMIAKAYAANRYDIIIMSGRDGVCYEATTEWLYENGIPWSALMMRRAGDQRKDSVVKEELFFEHVAPYYNIHAVYDDRPQVVRMWHDIGIPKVIAVADQNEEF